MKSIGRNLLLTLLVWVGHCAHGFQSRGSCFGWFSATTTRLTAVNRDLWSVDDVGKNKSTSKRLTARRPSAAKKTVVAPKSMSDAYTAAQMRAAAAKVAREKRKIESLQAETAKLSAPKQPIAVSRVVGRAAPAKKATPSNTAPAPKGPRAVPRVLAKQDAAPSARSAPEKPQAPKGSAKIVKKPIKASVKIPKEPTVAAKKPYSVTQIAGQPLAQKKAPSKATHSPKPVAKKKAPAKTPSPGTMKDATEKPVQTPKPVAAKNSPTSSKAAPASKQKPPAPKGFAKIQDKPTKASVNKSLESKKEEKAVEPPKEPVKDTEADVVPLEETKAVDIDMVVKEKFPDAISNQDLLTKVVGVLTVKGYTGSNTLLTTSLCCDELARTLEDDFYAVFGKNFNLGGLAGFPFAGRTGFGAMSAHIPDDGYCLIAFGPHVGITKDGLVGKVEREGIKLVDSCCGSAIAASNYLQGITDGGAQISTTIKKFSDFQQNAVQELILPHGCRLLNAKNRMLELPYALYESQNMLMGDIVKGGAGGLKKGTAVLGGVQINTGPGTSDYFHPLRFDYVDGNGEVIENLLPLIK